MDTSKLKVGAIIAWDHFLYQIDKIDGNNVNVHSSGTVSHRELGKTDTVIHELTFNHSMFEGNSYVWACPKHAIYLR